MRMNPPDVTLPTPQDLSPCLHCESYKGGLGSGPCQSCRKFSEYVDAVEEAEHNRGRKNQYYEERFRNRDKPIEEYPESLRCEEDEGDESPEPWYAYQFPFWRKFEELRRVDLTLFPLARQRAVFFYRLMGCKKKEVAKTLSVTPKTISQDLNKIETILHEQKEKRKTRGRPLKLGPLGFHKKNAWILERCPINRMALIKGLCKENSSPPLGDREIHWVQNLLKLYYVQRGGIDSAEEDHYLLGEYEHPYLVGKYREFVEFLERVEDAYRPTGQRYQEMAVGVPTNPLKRKYQKSKESKYPFRKTKTFLLR